MLHIRLKEFLREKYVKIILKKLKSCSILNEIQQIKMKKRKVLFHWPNTSNRGRIHMAMPILTALAKEKNWDYQYW